MHLSPTSKLGYLSFKVGCLCFTPHRQRGHLERASPFTVPCEGSEPRFHTVPIVNRTPGRRLAVHYTTAAPHQLHSNLSVNSITVLDLSFHIKITSTRNNRISLIVDPIRIVLNLVKQDNEKYYFYE